MTNRSLVLYHGGCPDGFGAAYLMHKHLAQVEGLQPELVACNYNEPMPDVTGRDVCIVDFCFPPEDLQRLPEEADSFVILDHHETARRWLDEGFGYHMDHVPTNARDIHRFAVLDETHSGAGLVKLYTGRDVGEPDWVDYLEDRDLWRFAYGDSTADAFAWITSFPYTVDAYDRLEREWQESPSRCIQQGAAIQRFRYRLVEQIIEDAEDILIAGVDSGYVKIVPAPYAVGSDVAGELAKMSGSCVGAYYIPKPDRGSLRVGLRSTPDGPNVAEIAEQFGGGGHPNAAGFEVPCDMGSAVEAPIHDVALSLRVEAPRD